MVNEELTGTLVDPLWVLRHSCGQETTILVYERRMLAITAAPSDALFFD
jgi:hypothetical protein